MKVAITGAGGYIGSFLAKELKEYDNIELILLSAGINDSAFVTTDYSNDSLCRILTGVDAVVHLAAIKNVRSYDDVLVNTDLTKAVTEACLRVNVRQIIFASSISVYSDETCLPWQETDPTIPDTLYGMSKLISENLLKAGCGDSVNWTILRFAHVIGDDMPGTYMIPTFFRRASEGMR